MFQGPAVIHCSTKVGLPVDQTSLEALNVHSLQYADCLSTTILSLDFSIQLNLRFFHFSSQDEIKSNCCSKLRKLTFFKQNGQV